MDDNKITTITALLVLLPIASVMIICWLFYITIGFTCITIDWYWHKIKEVFNNTLLK